MTKLGGSAVVPKRANEHFVVVDLTLTETEEMIRVAMRGGGGAAQRDAAAGGGRGGADTCAPAPGRVHRRHRRRRLREWHTRTAVLVLEDAAAGHDRWRMPLSSTRKERHQALRKRSTKNNL